MKAKKCFLFFDEFFEYIEKMNGDECKEYMMALAEYHYKGTMAQFDDRFMQSSFAKSIRLIADSDEKYREKVERITIINERRKAKMKAAAQEEATPVPEQKEQGKPKEEEQPKPKPKPQPKPVAAVEPIAEPEPIPEPPVNYEVIFEQQPPDEDVPQPTTNPELQTFTAAKIGDILVMNGKRVVKRSNGVFVIPTLDEVAEYIKEKGYHFQPSTFLEYYENSSPHPWHMANGKPVKSWKQCCTTFEQHVFLSEGRRAMARQQPASHAHDDINTKVYEPPY